MQQPIIKWSGSKRSQTDSILSHFPKEQINTYYEPFVGGGSVLYGVLKNGLCERVVASWNCQCECGKQKVITSKSLQSGTQSCGCNKRKPHIKNGVKG